MGAHKNIAIQIGNAKRNIVAPDSWDNLDPKTMHLLYATLFPGINDEFIASAMTSVKLISMTQYILQVGPDFLSKWEADCLKSDPEHGETIFLSELKAMVSAALSGLFDIVDDLETNTTTYACRLNRTKNPHQRLSNTTGKGKAQKTTVLYAPDDGLQNITIYELATLFTYFEQYLNTNDEEWANKLIGAMYRPSKPLTKEHQESDYHGDRRLPLRKYEKKVPERARLAATLPPLVRRVILFWFASCRQQIIERYGKVFKRGSGQGPNYGWGGVLLALAGGPVGLDAIADQHYSNALTWMAMKEDEREEMERNMPKK